MLLSTHEGRVALHTREGPLDVAAWSEGLIGPDVIDCLRRWDEFTAWARRPGAARPDPVTTAPGPCLPTPGQIFAIGLNYRLHALESGLEIPDRPMVFTKFASSVAGPEGVIGLFTDRVDWEVELALVIGRGGRHIGRADAWRHVAGLTVAQDFSARDVQLTPPRSPQFSMGKSFEGFLPLGATLATPEEFTDPDSIGLWCEINGERVQDGRTDDLIFDVATLISYLSSIAQLRPGDLILTGTPSGVGLGMKPPRYLRPGDVVTTGMDVVGQMTHRAVAPTPAWDWS